MKSTIITVASGIIVILTEMAISQPIYLVNSPQKYFGVSLAIPNFEENDDISARIMTFTLNTATPDKAGFVIAIPYVHYESGNDFWSPHSRRGFQDDAIGNLYLGYQSALNKNNIYAEFGSLIPLASEKKVAPLSVGIFGDFDNIEAYIPNCWTVRYALNYCPKNQSGFSGLLCVAPSLLIPTGERGMLEVFAHYRGQAWFYSGAFNMGVGILGFASLTEEGLAAERGIFSHQLLLDMNYRIGKCVPGFSWQIPLDGNAREFLSSTISLNVIMIIR